ncbi:hypothetical protein SODALDRAFT_333478 [Sodiomyces alkalinus F11]|uniref:Uncharacterized protein n=1 Tax=Sodiomyces alkalinus (strain CBS 110278 / VKM F-3762 / F11) TaxID=1314773 RepID=A0A3N2PWE8_SODAK|nr:hypothetical protein SODALDRAFT_333478 [Sodiomyces alkalinus F11]ROT38849.1 hypothetical protein SODALDRAFT_333478 [Sodiomyces alkalinus F11]
METINTMASAAAKAVWGDSQSREEPISGVQGNTAQGEPYDAGNMEPQKIQADAATPRVVPDGSNTDVHTNKTQTEIVGGTVASISEIDDAEREYTTKKSNQAGHAGGDSRDVTSHVNRSEVESSVSASGLDTPDPRPFQTTLGEHKTKTDTNIVKDDAKHYQLFQEASRDDVRNATEDHNAGERSTKATGLPAKGRRLDASESEAGNETGGLPQEDGHASLSREIHKDGHGGSGKRSLKERIKSKLQKH